MSLDPTLKWTADWIAVGSRAAACGCRCAVLIRNRFFIYTAWAPGVEIYLTRGKALSVFKIFPVASFSARERHLSSVFRKSVS